MSRFPNSAELGRVAALQAAVDARDAEIAGMESALDVLAEQKASLAARLSQVQANVPPPPPEFDEALVEAHAADPAAEVDATEIASAVEQLTAYQAATAGHAAEVAVQTKLTNAAVARIDTKADEMRAAIEAARVARAGEYVDLLSGAHAYLIGRFTAELGRLRADFVDPMIAIQNVKDAQHTPLINVRSHLSICEGSQVRVKGRGENGGYGVTELLDFSLAAIKRIDQPAVLAALQNDLRAAGPG